MTLYKVLVSPASIAANERPIAKCSNWLGQEARIELTLTSHNTSSSFPPSTYHNVISSGLQAHTAAKVFADQALGIDWQIFKVALAAKIEELEASQVTTSENKTPQAWGGDRLTPERKALMIKQIEGQNKRMKALLWDVDLKKAARWLAREAREAGEKAANSREEDRMGNTVKLLGA